MTEQCQRCKEDGDDRRTLWMACFYEMMELNIPFEKERIREGGIHDDHPNNFHNFYTLRVCKQCRGDWMKALKEWFAKPVTPIDSCGSGIYLREYGAIVEITEEEWQKRNKERNPVTIFFDEEPK